MNTPILEDIQTHMNFYGYSILLVFGVIGNIFILILFCRQRHHPCSIYLTGSAVANILCLTSGSSFNIFYSSYNDGGLRTIISCKLFAYIPAMSGQVTKTLLIFACIDRYMITSRSVWLRPYSTPRRAKYITCGTYAICAIASSDTLIGITASHGQCIKVDWYVVFSPFCSLLFVSVVPSLSLCIFGYLTLRNMRQLYNRIQPTQRDMSDNKKNNRSLKRRDREFSVLVLAEVLVYIITTAPFTITTFESMITLFVVPVKSRPLLQAETFAFNVAVIFIDAFSAVPFYTYMVVSTSFRRDFKQSIFNGYHTIMRRLTFN